MHIGRVVTCHCCFGHVFDNWIQHQMVVLVVKEWTKLDAINLLLI